jgi:hypothetical protein
MAFKTATWRIWGRPPSPVGLIPKVLAGNHVFFILKHAAFLQTFVVGGFICFHVQPYLGGGA